MQCFRTALWWLGPPGSLWVGGKVTRLCLRAMCGQVALRRCLGAAHIQGMFVPNPHDARFMRAEDRGFIGFEQDVEVGCYGALGAGEPPRLMLNGLPGAVRPSAAVRGGGQPVRQHLRGQGSRSTGHHR